MGWLDLVPGDVRHILITHQDTDHVGAVEADEVGWNGRPYSASLELPPFGTVYLAPRDKEALKLAKIAAEEKRRAAEAEEAARAAEEAEGEELEAEDSEEAEGGED